MITKKSITALVLCTAIVFAISFGWHNIIFHDFERLNRSKSKLLFYSFCLSFVISFVMLKLYEFDIMERHFAKKPLLRGLVVGVVCGVLYFFISTYGGFSFNTSTSFKQSLVDLIYQVFEESLGGIVIGMVFIAFFDPDVQG